MAKKNINNEIENENIGVNTPERNDDMDENNDIFNEEKAEEFMEDLDDDDQDDLEDSEDDKAPEKKVGLIKRFVGWVKKHPVIATIGGFSLIAVGGVFYLYKAGKAPIKLGKAEEAIKKLTDGKETAEVLDFAEEAKKLAEDMVKDPENWDVQNG